MMRRRIYWCSLLLSLLQGSGDSFLPLSSRIGRAQENAPRLFYRQRQQHDEDLYAAVHRKEYELEQVAKQHTSTTDPVRMALTYAQESVPQMRLAKALRRVYEDPSNPANPNAAQAQAPPSKRQEQLQELGMRELGLRRPSFIVDIKRQSKLTHGGAAQPFCQFDSAAMVAQAMVRLGADAVFINTDYPAYGGDYSELSMAVNAVRQVSETAAVVAKDLVVDELQLGLAKHAGADAILLISSVLGPALPNFVDLATTIGLETIVECHTRNEVEFALNQCCAQTILVNNYDRIGRQYHPQQAIQLAGLFPGSGGPVICLATGGIADTDTMKRHLAVGYDGIVVGKAVMGSPAAPEFIRAVRDRTCLPAELSSSQWGLENVELDVNGNLMMMEEEEPRRSPNMPNYDDDVYQ